MSTFSAGVRVAGAAGHRDTSWDLAPRYTLARYQPTVFSKARKQWSALQCSPYNLSQDIAMISHSDGILYLTHFLPSIAFHLTLTQIHVSSRIGRDGSVGWGTVSGVAIKIHIRKDPVNSEKKKSWKVTTRIGNRYLMAHLFKSPSVLQAERLRHKSR